MSNATKTSFDELMPYVRRAGKQFQHGWKNKFRRIYDHAFYISNVMKKETGLSPSQWREITNNITV